MDIRLLTPYSFCISNVYFCISKMFVVPVFSFSSMIWILAPDFLPLEPFLGRFVDISAMKDACHCDRFSLKVL